MDAHELKYGEEIERYLDGEMTEQERVAFEERLADDAVLKAEFAVLYEIVKQVKENKRASLKSLLEKTDAELDNKTSTKTIPLQPKRNYLTAIAASLVLVLGISVAWYSMKLNTNEKLAAKYWQKDAGLPVLMAENKEIIFDNAMSAFKAGEHKFAYKQFEKIPTNDTVAYYKALCQHELNQSPKENLLLVANNNESVFNAKAKYYLLLVYIKDNNKAEAKKTLQELLTNTTHPYYNSIQQLSKEAFFK